MGLLDKEPDENAPKEAASRDDRQAPSARPLPCNDATGRVVPITPEEQARDAMAIADLVERMLAMPDEDPPGAWEEAMRNLDPATPPQALRGSLLIMARLILMDSGPLGLIVRAPASCKSCVVSPGSRPSQQPAQPSSSLKSLIMKSAANSFESARSGACDAWSIISIPVAA